ncbi:MAG: hypothetical protein M3450_10150 [Actinomycetota bacterium]|nr:hypothetical protein [Actinomycetota bacterium]
MSDDLLDAISLLRRKRADHLAQVEKIDAALAALAAVIEEPEQRQNGESRPSGLAARVVEKIGQAQAQAQTTRQKIVSLAEEADRNWSAGQMISEYQRRGEPFAGANPDSAVRAAIVTAMQKDELYRTAYGRYRATKFRPSEPDVGMDFDNSNGHHVSEDEEVFTP